FRAAKRRSLAEPKTTEDCRVDNSVAPRRNTIMPPSALVLDVGCRETNDWRALPGSSHEPDLAGRSLVFFGACQCAGSGKVRVAAEAGKEDRELLAKEAGCRRTADGGQVNPVRARPDGVEAGGA